MTTVWLVVAAAIAAGVGMGGWLSGRRTLQYRKVQLYMQAVALALAAWGRDQGDPHRLDPRTHHTCRVAIDLSARRSRPAVVAS